VVTDMIMPGMDGCELATQIRALETPGQPKPPPVVGLTGTTQSSELQRCLDSGMTTVLGKPVDMGELNTTLEKLVTRPISASSPRSSPRSNPPSPRSIPPLTSMGAGGAAMPAAVRHQERMGREIPSDGHDLEAGLGTVASGPGNNVSERSNKAPLAYSSAGRPTASSNDATEKEPCSTLRQPERAPPSLNFFEDIDPDADFDGGGEFDTGLNEEDDL
jgi:hypothetical protein